VDPSRALVSVMWTGLGPGFKTTATG